MSKYKGLIHFYFYKIKASMLNKILNSKNEYKIDDLPRYTFNDKNNVVSVDSWFQFGAGEEDKYFILFDYECGDKVVDEEFNNSGLDSFDIDIDLEKVTINELTDYARIPTPTLVWCEIIWSRDYFGEYDIDYDIYLVKKKKAR